MVKKSKSQIEAEKGAKETAIVVEDALRNIADKVGDIFKEALDSTDNVAKAVAKDITSSLNSLAKVSKELANANSKAAEGAFKQADAAKLIQQRQAKIQAINYQISMLGRGDLKQKKALQKELTKVQGYNDEFEKGLQEQLDLSAKITSQMGLTGAALGALKTVAGKLGLGSISDALDNANSAALEVAKNSSGLTGKFKVLGAAIGSLGKSFIGFITDPIAMITAMVKGFQALLSLGQKFAQKTADLGKAFMGANTGAKMMKNNLADMADSNLYLNFEEAKKALVGLNKVAGTSVMLSEEQINNYQKFTHFLGLSEEAAQGLFKVSTLSGKEFGDTALEIGTIVKGLNFATDSAISMNDVMEEVSSASAASIANIGANPEALAKAAFQAKRLGMTLDQVAAAGESNLDFQSSIEKEMAAELLLGKNLNLEALRSASLRGDEVTVAKEMERILAANYDSTKGNKIQQKALADSLGISVEEMHKMNQTRLLQNKLGDMDAATREAAEKKVNQLMKEGKTQKEAIASLVEKELADTVKQGKTAEASQRALEQAKGVLQNSLAPLAAKVADAIAKFVNSKTFQSGMKLMASIMGKVVDGIVSVLPMIKKLFIMIKDNPIKSLLGAGAAIGIGKMLGIGGKMGSASNPMHVVFGKGGAMSKTFNGIKNLFKKKPDALAKASTKFSSKQIAAGFGGKAAKDQLAKQSLKSTTKVGAKLGVKAVGKSLLKKIPVVGLLAGIGFGLKRAMKGDFAGAALELASGAASTIPGLGTAASVAIDAGLAAKDYKAATGGGSTAADFISRPGQPIQKFRKDDIIVGGTSLGGGGNNGEVIALLKELISEVKKGGDVFMDGNKVGKSLALATSNMG